MTGSNDLDRMVASYLEEGPRRAPDRAVDAALTFAATHPRRRDPLLFLKPDVMARRSWMLQLAARLGGRRGRCPRARCDCGHRDRESSSVARGRSSRRRWWRRGRHPSSRARRAALASDVQRRRHR